MTTMYILEKTISLFAPHNCKVCSQEGTLLCPGCLPGAMESLPGRCYRCKKLDSNSMVCKGCRRLSPLQHVWVHTDYIDLAKDLIYDLKFNRIKAAADPIAELMIESLPFLPDAVFVPVPTATRRRRIRGYDQSELIAKAIAKQNKGHYARLLERLGQSRQVGARKAMRQKQLGAAFRPLKPYLIKDAHIVLVDDIVTTGATLEAAARTLKTAGAKKIDALVFAQKM